MMCKERLLLCNMAFTYARHLYWTLDPQQVWGSLKGFTLQHDFHLCKTPILNLDPQQVWGSLNNKKS